jgi:hypothetical protein
VIIIQYVTEKHGALAQLGERYTGSVEVSGSSPLCSTKGKPSDVPGVFYIFIYAIKKSLPLPGNRTIEGFF